MSKFSGPREQNDLGRWIGFEAEWVWVGLKTARATLRFGSHIIEDAWRLSGFDKWHRKVKCCGVSLCTLGQTHMPLQLMRWRRGHLGLDITSVLACPLFGCRLSHLITTFLTQIDCLQVQFKFESSCGYLENDDRRLVWPRVSVLNF